MERLIFRELDLWKMDPERKPLLVRGARQIGKTYIIRKLGEAFDNYLEVNFDAEPEVATFFKGNLHPDEICIKLSAYYNIPITNGKTILFFDEIQACIPAMKSLRYFYEKRPGLHVIATGSLLEFAIREITSFGVGRIQSLFMYPMSFNEFLLAAGQKGLIEMKQKSSSTHPIDDAFHRTLNDWLRKFIIIGGMPEAVKTFLQTNDFQKTQKVLDDIILSLEDDFSKYKQRVNVNRIKDVFQSVIYQQGNKFIVSKSSENGNQEQKREALDMLIMSGLCYPIFHSSAEGIPLSIGKKEKFFKLIFFDTGISQRLLKLNMKDYIIAENLNQINKGKIAEQYAGIEMIKKQFINNRPELYYWHREKRGSNAEVDYVLEKDGIIIPVEIKANIQGKMQSLRIFLALKNAPYGIRISMEPFSQYEKIHVYPLYAVDRIFET
jgi:hypothetical protein